MASPKTRTVAELRRETEHAADEWRRVQAENAAKEKVAQLWYVLEGTFQYQGPTTGGRPVHDGRFNMTERRPIAEENVER